MNFGTFILAEQPTINIGAIVMLAVWAFILAVVVIGLIRLVRLLLQLSKELKLIRIEFGKIADDLQKLLLDKSRQ